MRRDYGGPADWIKGVRMDRLWCVPLAVILLALYASCTSTASVKPTHEPPQASSPNAARQWNMGPESRYGLMLHLSKAEVLRLMRNQGFRFESDPADSGSFEPVMFVPDDFHIVDEMALVYEREGSVHLWHSDYVALGFSNNELVLIFDAPDNAMPRADSDVIFAEMKDLLTKTCGEPFDVWIPFKFREATIGAGQIFAHAHWKCPRYSVDLFVGEDLSQPWSSSPRTRVAVVYYDPLFVGLEEEPEH